MTKLLSIINFVKIFTLVQEEETMWNDSELTLSYDKLIQIKNEVSANIKVKYFLTVTWNESKFTIPLKNKKHFS